MRHSSKKRQYKYPCQLRSRQRENRSRKKYGLIISYRSLQAQDLTCPFALTYWPSWLISPRITILELLRLLKETREALRDALANSESFLTCMPEIPNDDAQSPCPECHHVQSKVPAVTFTAEDMLLKDNKHDRLYTTPDTSVQHALKGYRSIRGLHSASPQKAPLLPRYITIQVVRNHYYNIQFQCREQSSTWENSTPLPNREPEIESDVLCH